MAGGIECEICEGTDFQTFAGATFCTNCGAESQEHGQETIVDEETLGAFGDHASALKSKAIGERKRKGKSRSEKDKCKVSFTSIDLFTHTLKGKLK